MSGRAISAVSVRDADVLLVRSVTRVDPNLLAGSRVQFVGSATIGTDHIDKPHLAQHDIAFAHAPGSNADSVVEYVMASLLHLAVQKNEPLRGKTVGIVGCGNIGSRLAQRLPAFGLRVLRNDPPLADQAGDAARYVSLDQILEEAEIITLHVPLTHTGRYPTNHLFDEALLACLPSHVWLLNTCRGPVVDNVALRKRQMSSPLAALVLDVWENEPALDMALLNLVDLGTPHIAGYSYDGKVTGTVMLYKALIKHLEQPPHWNPASIYAPTSEDDLSLTPPPARLPEHAWLHHLVSQMYPIQEDDQRLRNLCPLAPENQGPYFTQLRKSYPRRRSFTLHHIPTAEVPQPYTKAVRDGLGVQLV